jgi:hypothetical protein
MTEQPPTPPPSSSGGWFAGIIDASKSLTLTNVLVIAMLVIVAVPAYAVYQALNDPVLLDRFLSSYTEVPNKSTDCTIRKARARGGAWLWSISAGFAFQRSDRWSVSVILPAEPSADDIVSYCATLALIVDKMLFNADGNPAP